MCLCEIPVFLDVFAILWLTNNEQFVKIKNKNSLACVIIGHRNGVLNFEMLSPGRGPSPETAGGILNPPPSLFVFISVSDFYFFPEKQMKISYQIAVGREKRKPQLHNNNMKGVKITFGLQYFVFRLHCEFWNEKKNYTNCKGGIVGTNNKKKMKVYLKKDITTEQLLHDVPLIWMIHFAPFSFFSPIYFDFRVSFCLRPFIFLGVYIL